MEQKKWRRSFWLYLLSTVLLLYTAYLLFFSPVPPGRLDMRLAERASFTGPGEILAKVTIDGATYYAIDEGDGVAVYTKEFWGTFTYADRMDTVTLIDLIRSSYVLFAFDEVPEAATAELVFSNGDTAKAERECQGLFVFALEKSAATGPVTVRFFDEDSRLIVEVETRIARYG